MSTKASDYESYITFMEMRTNEELEVGEKEILFVQIHRAQERRQYDNDSVTLACY